MYGTLPPSRLGVSFNLVAFYSFSRLHFLSLSPVLLTTFQSFCFPIINHQLDN